MQQTLQTSRTPAAVTSPVTQPSLDCCAAAATSAFKRPGLFYVLGYPLDRHATRLSTVARAVRAPTRLRCFRFPSETPPRGHRRKISRYRYVSVGVERGGAKGARGLP